jgi:SOS-response transcriptional repressor LexA
MEMKGVAFVKGKYSGLYVANFPVDEVYEFEMRQSLRLPLMLTAVRAGFPSPAEDHVDRALDLNEYLVKHPAATYFLRVSRFDDWGGHLSGDCRPGAGSEDRTGGDCCGQWRIHG